MNQTTLNITFEYKDTSESEIKIPVKDFKGAGINKTEDKRVPHLRFPTQVESSLAYKTYFPSSNEKQDQKHQPFLKYSSQSQYIT